MCVTPCIPPMPSATSATRTGSLSRVVSLLFSRPRKAAAGAYGIAAKQAVKISCAAAAICDGSWTARVTADSSRRSWTRRARRSRPACENPSDWRRASRSRSLMRRSTASSHARSRACASSGPEVRPIPEGAAAGVALRHHALDHPQDRCRVRGVGALAAAERADRERHRGVRPLRGRALLAVRAHLAGANVREELVRSASVRRLRPGAADVDAGVIVAAADADPAVGLDVDRGRVVELARPRAVADLPDPEQLRQPPAVAGHQRRLDGVERMRERARDLALVQVLGDDLDVVRVGLQPVVVVRRDPVTEDVHGLGLAAEARGQLLGHEHVGAVRDLEHPGDRVVIGDRHEVHAAALGQGVDLLGRRGALRQAQRSLDAELGHLRRRRVAVQVRTAGLHVSRESGADCRGFVTNWTTTL